MIRNTTRLRSLGLTLAASIAITRLAQAEFATTQFDFFADSGNTIIYRFYANTVIAETFTPAVSGTLTSVETTIHRASNTGVPLKFEIRPIRDTGINGLQPDLLPGATVLASGTLAASDPQFDTFFITWKKTAMSATPLQAGTLYGLVVSAIGSADAYDWYTKINGTGYPDGRLLLGYNGDTILAGQNPYDVPFRINIATNVFPPQIQGATNLPNGNFQFTFGNLPDTTFNVLSSTNPALPLNAWTNLGNATQTSPGQYQFSDNRPNRPAALFYRVRY